MTSDKYKYELKPLPYDYSSLEPFIDSETMHFHHDKHLGTYINNLNLALENYPDFQNWTLFELVKNYKNLPVNLQTPIKNNAGGVYNHYLYFDIMTPGGSPVPIGNLGKKINDIFGSYENFKTEFKNMALKVFGSGYAVLVSDKNGNIRIISMPNQDTSLPDDLYPIILIDVWEHAYYLKYQNRRNEYIDNWFNLINWNIAEKNYSRIIF